MTDHQEASALEGQTLGKYRVRRLLGAGGMGAVYEVEHVLTRRGGALKLLHGSYAAVGNVVERFLREASAAGRIGNSHIVETFDAGELPNGQPYIFMELLQGQSLGASIRSSGRLGFAEARELVMQAAEGLAAAHAAGIVHRDIKPDNLFVCSGEVPFVKVLDFGISKFAEQLGESRLTEHGAALGTPHYMAPEQVVGKREIDTRTDVYALGVVLYECLTGRVPFDAPTLPALSVAIFEGNFTPVSELVAEVPQGLDSLIARAMARDPGRRFASMLEFRAALAGIEAPASGGAESELARRTVALEAASPREAAPPTALPPTLPATSVELARPRASTAGAARGTRRYLLVGALLGALALAALLVLDWSGGAPRDSAGSDPLTPSAGPPAAEEAHPHPTLSSSPRLLLEEERAPQAPSSASSRSSIAREPPARQPRPPSTAPSTRPAPQSSAAADGLSERNPFAD